jgi:methionine sulfoxide reductase heme-binding subunit
MTPFTDRTGRFSVLKTATLAGLAAPAVWLFYRALAQDLGPLPVKEALLFCGLWAVRFLLVTLALTPAQRFFNLPRLALIRRMTGIAAFAYALGHVSLYVAMEKFDLLFVVREIAQRYYLVIGFAALLGLSALAATSTDAMVRKLGTRWKQLHKLVYGIAALAILHFFMQSKIDASEATLMAGLFVTLMVYRVVIRFRLPATALTLALAAGASAIITAGLEFAWYGLAKGIDPWRVLAANLMIGHGPRPAVLLVLAGLAVMLAVTLYRSFNQPGAIFRTRTAG